MIAVAYHYRKALAKAVKMSKAKILVALDVAKLEDAKKLVNQLANEVFGFKVGLELCGAAGVPAVVDDISQAGGSVFLDLKFKDIPNTVYGAVKACCRPGVFMLNVHCDGGKEMMKAAVRAATESQTKPLLIGVTILTSIDNQILNNELKIAGSLSDQAIHLALLARECGLNGVVCSPHEATAIKSACGADFITVVPGVRPSWASSGDQKRVMTPGEAARQGADYLVIGRPITNPPESIGTPSEAAKAIAQEISLAITG